LRASGWQRKADFLAAPATAGALNLSGAAEADGNFAGFDDHGHVAAALGILEHALQPLFVFEHVDVLERDLAPVKRLPGARRVGSEIFAENQDLFVHASLEN
jgi:hypothetical protein